MRKSFVALLLCLGAAASMTGLALAQSVEEQNGDLANKMVSRRSNEARVSAAARVSPARTFRSNQLSGPDSTWVGHSVQVQNNADHNTYSWGPYHVGVGRNMPYAPNDGAYPGSSNSGVWTWDHFQAGETDSLQGWWPMRRVYSITGGLTLADTKRPWWAVDIGNMGNYVLNSGQRGTFGVLSYWHVDGGNKNNPSPTFLQDDGSSLPPMSWAPLNGNASAWCGLRNHGDRTYTDPITGGAYNASVLEMVGESGGGTTSGVGTSKHFPGYPGQMDQMLYRDVEMTAVELADWDVSAGSNIITYNPGPVPGTVAVGNIISGLEIVNPNTASSPVTVVSIAGNQVTMSANAIGTNSSADVAFGAEPKLTLTYKYRTAMSTSVTTTASTRTGWFQFDPTTLGAVAVPGGGPNNGVPNYISNSAAAQPADSFLTYVGAPVNIDDLYLADGTHKVLAGGKHGVYDLKRRWMSEVVALNKPLFELDHRAGNNNATWSSAVDGLLPNAGGISLWKIWASQTGATRYGRLVFRVKTNRGFDDMGASTTGAYCSAGVGAAMVDDVTIAGNNIGGAAVGVSTFEATSDINNGSGTDALALGAWRATGKPPAIFHHNHPIQGGAIGTGNVYSALVFQDICGDVNAPSRFCNMKGVVISSGDHDKPGEPAGGLVDLTPERERMDGIMSPTVLMASSGSGDYNAAGIDRDIASVADDYYVWYDIYTGVYNLFFTGNAWWFGFQSYPGRSAARTDVQAGDLPVRMWGEVRMPGFQIFNPDIQCLFDFEAAIGNGLIRTTNSGSRPDSMRVYLGKNQQCFRFGVTGSGCSPKDGSYFDNAALLYSDFGGGGGGGNMAMDIWRFVNDAFPVNDGDPSGKPPAFHAVLPGTAEFDTTSAQLKTGINIAQSPGDEKRFQIGGDSVIVIAVEDRVDMVFRIKPGVGNYHQVGNMASGLRPIPTDAVNVVGATYYNDPYKDFWHRYIDDAGEVSSEHNGLGFGHDKVNYVWNRNVWNSARIDTSDVNIFPVQGNTAVFDVNATFAGTFQWMACYHESDPKYSNLGIPHNRCFLNDYLTVSSNSLNLTCSSVPGWVTLNAPGDGYDGNQQTKEGTKVIPDGLLTPGAHVEYFFRGQLGETPSFASGTYDMVPDTHYVNPQNDEGSSDGHRWQQFGVLPDRWKHTSFDDGEGLGQGMACMLYVDLNDRRGNERQWVSIADSIGATASARRGAHNGWAANCNACITSPVGDPLNVSGDPTISRYTHGGQPGTTWDMYGVKASESLTTSAGALGGRLGQQATGLATGMDCKSGPTPLMLRTYYKALLILTGDLNSGIFGKFINRGANDVTLLTDYMTDTAPQGAGVKRAVWIMGDGFVQSEYATGNAGNPGFSAEHANLLTGYLGVTIKKDASNNPQYSYQPWSGNAAQYSNLDMAATGLLPGNLYRVGNACLWGNDVLDPIAPVGDLNPKVNATYEAVGTHAPYVASIETPVQGLRFVQTIVDAWDIEHLFSRYNVGSIAAPASVGRIDYMSRTLAALQTTLSGCVLQGAPLITLDAPPISDGRLYTDFMQLRNNPYKNGRANVHFGLSQKDRVTARVYDVSGRLVRTLADRTFEAGEWDLYWDGTDDGGRQMERGVYFAQLKYAKGFNTAMKMVMLK